MSKQKQHERRYQLWGWYIFIGSAICFTIASARSGDWLTLAGSLLFLGACILFLVPFYHTPADEGDA
jgi:hypothetical protein